VLLLFSVSLVPAIATTRNDYSYDHRKSVAKQMARQFAPLSSHNFIVPDPGESSIRPVDRGAF
jgi:hypothetical protein